MIDILFTALADDRTGDEIQVTRHLRARALQPLRKWPGSKAWTSWRRCRAPRSRRNYACAWSRLRNSVSSCPCRSHECGDVLVAGASALRASGRRGRRASDVCGARRRILTDDLKLTDSPSVIFAAGQGAIGPSSPMPAWSKSRRLFIRGEHACVRRQSPS